MVLPQGFKNSPMILGELLAKDLRMIKLTDGVSLQYADEFFIASPTYEFCLNNTILVLSHLADSGYKISPHKAQVCQ